MSPRASQSGLKDLRRPHARGGDAVGRRGSALIRLGMRLGRDAHMSPDFQSLFVHVMRGGVLVLLTLYAIQFWLSVDDLDPVASRYPQILVVLLLMLLTVELVRALRAVAYRHRGTDGASDSAAEHLSGLWPRTVLTVAATLAYIWAFIATGFVLPTVALILALCGILKCNKKETAALVLLVPLLSGLVFSFGLQLRFELWW